MKILSIRRVFIEFTFLECDLIKDKKKSIFIDRIYYTLNLITIYFKRMQPNQYCFDLEFNKSAFNTLAPRQILMIALTPVCRPGIKRLKFYSNVTKKCKFGVIIYYVNGEQDCFYSIIFKEISLLEI